MSTRLLGGSSASFDAEEALLAGLKTDAGAMYVRALRNKMVDFKYEDKSMASYSKTWASEGASLIAAEGDPRAAQASCDDGAPFEFNCKVLTGAFWPMTQSPAEQVPPPLPIRVAIDHHRNAYYSQHTDDRKLRYSIHLGSSEMTFRPRNAPGKQYTVTASTLQCIALLRVQRLEAEGTAPTVGTLCSGLGLEIPVLQRVLDPMLKPSRFKASVGLLLKSSAAGRTRPGPMQKDDAISINDAFQARRRKIAVRALPLSVKAHATKSRTDVALQRNSAMDACIVRIMKSRKAMKIADLVAEAGRQIRTFEVDPRACKARIEVLVEGDYLERSDKDATVLEYVA